MIQGNVNVILQLEMSSVYKQARLTEGVCTLVPLLFAFTSLFLIRSSRSTTLIRPLAASQRVFTRDLPGHQLHQSNAVT